MYIMSWDNLCSHPVLRLINSNLSYFHQHGPTKRPIYALNLLAYFSAEEVWCSGLVSFPFLGRERWRYTIMSSKSWFLIYAGGGGYNGLV
jgi:hypothetical protein